MPQVLSVCVLVAACVSWAWPGRAGAFDYNGLATGPLPTGDVFEPLWADPRWPVFSAAYNRYVGDRFLENTGAFGIGETIPVWRWQDPPRLPVDLFEVGLQAGIFSVFDQDRPSRDMFNADYVFSAYAAARTGPLSGKVRLYHGSSHVGDEYLTNDAPVFREDFSHERFDLLLSYDLLGNPYRAETGLLRFYGGGMVGVIRPSPREWGFFRFQYGVEARHPDMFYGLRPVAAVDVAHQGGTGYSPDLTVRFGVQGEHPTINGRVVRLLFEYYNGKNPNGQFWRDDAEILGFGFFFGL